MRSAYIGACAGVVIFGMSLGGFAQPPEGKGKPADAGRSPIVQFPVPQHSVGVMHAASVIQSQRPAAPPPSMTAPGSASRGIGHAFGHANANGTGAIQGANVPGNGFVKGTGNGNGNGNSNGLGIDQIGKAPSDAISIAQIEKEPADEKRRSDGSLYSLQAVLPVAPGAFPAIQQSVPIPECLGR
jgi:hypothetical protein